MTKTKQILAGALSVLAVMSLDSCGSKGIVVRADDYDAETIVDLMNEEEPVVNPEQRPRPTKKGKKPMVNTPLDGEWIIVNAAGEDISFDEEMPYVIFSDAEGRFYAYNGCNYINGDFEYQNDMLTFDNTVTTLRACEDIDYPKAISTVLADDVKVKTKIENKDKESYLYLYTSGDDLLMTLRRHNLEVLNGQWEVQYIGKEEVDGSEINLFLDIPEHSIHGNTGCNYFNGVIVINPDVPSSISFAQMGVTMRYCDNSDLERQLLVSLEETETYTQKDSNTLYLNDAQGHHLITLKRK